MKITLKKIISKFLWLFLIFVLFPLSVSDWFSGLSWFFEFVSFFRLQFLFLSGAGFLFTIAFKWRTLSVFYMICFVFNLAVILQSSIPRSNSVDDIEVQYQGDILMLELPEDPKDRFRVKDLIREKKPLMTLMFRVTPAWRWFLEEHFSNKDFKHRLIQERSDSEGLALLSRVPLAAAGIWYFKDNSPYFFIELDSSSGLDLPVNKLSILALNLRPPVSAAAREQRAQHLEEIRYVSQALSEPVALLGNFSSPPWARKMKNWEGSSGFNSLFRSDWFFRSWPTQTALLSLPLSYGFVSPHTPRSLIRIKSTTWSVGSDAYPVIFQIGDIEP